MAKHSSQSPRANRDSTENPLEHAKGSVPADFAARLAAGRRRTKVPASSSTRTATSSRTGEGTATARPRARIPRRPAVVSSSRRSQRRGHGRHLMPAGGPKACWLLAHSWPSFPASITTMESETERKRRTNARGHIHRSTLRASLARLEGAGIFTSWKTNGRLVGRLRMPAVRVWRLNRTAWARAWATLKHTLRRKMYTVRAEAYSTKKRKSGGDFVPPPLGRKVPVWLKDNDAGKR